MAKPTEVTEATFQSTVLENKLPVIVDFWATWCPPCRILHPIIDQFADDYEGKVAVCKVDVDANQSLAQKYGIRGIPTILMFKNGEIRDQVVGALPKEQLKPKVDALIEG
jgi:thioredoxin 1